MSDRKKQLQAATKANVYRLFLKVIYMNAHWILYLPVWCTKYLFDLFSSTISHVVTIPDLEAQAIYIRPAVKDADGHWEPGALELKYTDTHNAASVNLHYAAAEFNKKPGKGRRLAIPVKLHQDPDLGWVLRLDMKAAQIVKGEAADSLLEPPDEEAAAGRMPDGGPAPAGPATPDTPAE